jgi:hypothetical protein
VTSTKTAIIVLSDPNMTGDESLGRVFNALATALELDTAGRDVTVRFQGAGTRWPAALAAPTHPAHDLFEAVRHNVAGVSCGCAAVFGATESATSSGMVTIADNPVAGTTGLASLMTLLDDGYTVVTF